MTLAELVLVGPGKLMVAIGRAQALVGLGLDLASPLIIKLVPIQKLYTTNVITYS